MSGTTAPVQASAQLLPLDKGKQKEVCFEKLLKKDPSKELNAPFCFDMLTQLANIPARITLHELLCLLKEMREAVRDALTHSESFLMQVPALTKEDGASCPQCYLVQQQVMHHLHS